MNKKVSQKVKVLMLLGVIEPYTCEDKYDKQMLEFYLLNAKDKMPDLKWSIRVLKKEEAELIKEGEGK